MKNVLAGKTFSAQLDQFASTVQGRLQEVQTGVAFECAESIIVGASPGNPDGTPVDTGFARASWWLAVGGEGAPPLPPDAERAVKAGLATRDALGESAAALGHATVGTPIFILSNTAYMEALELGHSKQAPQGMVGITVEAGQQILNKVVAAVLARGRRH